MSNDNIIEFPGKGDPASSSSDNGDPFSKTKDGEQFLDFNKMQVVRCDVCDNLTWIVEANGRCVCAVCSNIVSFSSILEAGEEYNGGTD